MRKLTLALEALEVESFDVAPHSQEKGTVLGRQVTDLGCQTMAANGYCTAYTQDVLDAMCAASHGMEVEWGCTDVCYSTPGYGCDTGEQHC